MWIRLPILKTSLTDKIRVLREDVGQGMIILINQMLPKKNSTQHLSRYGIQYLIMSKILVSLFSFFFSKPNWWICSRGSGRYLRKVYFEGVPVKLCGRENTDRKYWLIESTNLFKWHGKGFFLLAEKPAVHGRIREGKSNERKRGNSRCQQRERRVLIKGVAQRERPPHQGYFLSVCT